MQGKHTHFKTGPSGLSSQSFICIFNDVALGFKGWFKAYVGVKIFGWKKKLFMALFVDYSKIRDLLKSHKIHCNFKELLTWELAPPLKLTRECTVSHCFCLTAHNLPYLRFASVKLQNNYINEGAKIKHLQKKKESRSWANPKIFHRAIQL